MKDRIKQVIRAGVMLLKSEKKVAIPYPVNVSKLLSGKTALITGGSGGIGMAIAQAFIASGCEVVIAGTNEQKLEACCERMGETVRKPEMM